MGEVNVIPVSLGNDGLLHASNTGARMNEAAC